MMSQHSGRKTRRKKKDKHSKAKLAVIPVLLLVLGYILYDGLAGDPSSLPPTTLVASPIQVQPGQAGQAASKPQAVWEEAQLSSLLTQNPFHDYSIIRGANLPSGKGGEDWGIAERALANRDVQLAAESKLAFDVPYVFQSNGQSKAILDGKVVSVGEEVVDGVSLQTILPGKMVFQQNRNLRRGEGEAIH